MVCSSHFPKLSSLWFFSSSINIKFIEITEISTGNVMEMWCSLNNTTLLFYLTSPFPGVNGKLNKRQRRRKADSTGGLSQIIIPYLCQYDICHNQLFHIWVNTIFYTNTFMFNLGQYLSLCLFNRLCLEFLFFIVFLLVSVKKKIPVFFPDKCFSLYFWKLKGVYFLAFFV